MEYGETEHMAGALSDSDYAAMAAFRHSLRLLVRAANEAAEAAGLTAQQHQLLLAVRGRNAPAPVGWLAEQMLIQPNSASELVGRLEVMGLVERSTPDDDRRRVQIALTQHGRRVLGRIAADDRARLQELKPLLAALTARL